MCVCVCCEHARWRVCHTEIKTVTIFLLYIDKIKGVLSYLQRRDVSEAKTDRKEGRGAKVRGKPKE